MTDQPVELEHPQHEDALKSSGNRNLDQLLRVTKEKIQHLLTVFPAISQSMLQTGIGTSQSPKLWRPILNQMIDDGEVVVTKVTATSPHDRHQVYSVYHRADFDYAAYRSKLPGRHNVHTATPQPAAQPNPDTLAPAPTPNENQAA